MAPPSRREVLRLSSGLGVAGLAGCTSSLSAEGSDSGGPPCDGRVYKDSESDTGGELPWHLFIRNIPLSTYPLALTIADVSGATPSKVASCTARTASHRQLVFDLTPDTPYRVEATLDRPENPEMATATVSGWNRVTGPDEALRVAVGNDGFEIQRVHYDTAETPPDGSA